MPLKSQLLALGLALLATTAAAGRAEPPPAVQRTFDELYAANGITRVKKPALRMSSDNQKVAAFYPSKNTVVLDEKAWEICRSMGRDSLAALAFIFGHELAHAYQTEIKEGRVKTSFLAYDKAFAANVRTEKTADVQGLFSAQLAGHDALRAMPVILEKIYDGYGLNNKWLPGYPTLDERKAAAAEVQKLAEELLDLFEFSNYSMVVGKPGLAAEGYEHILEYYQGREIWNNLGLASCLAAEEYWSPKEDGFVHPLEADWASKLAEAEARGEGGLDPILQPLRTAMLERAAEAFAEAQRADPGYLTAAINRVSVLNMMGKPAEALAFFEKNVRPVIAKKKMRHSPERQMAQVAEAISYAMLPGRMPEATSLLQTVAATGLPVPALYAQLNFDRLTGQKSQNERGMAEWPLPEKFKQMTALMQFDGPDGMERTAVNERDGLFFSKKRGAAGGGTFTFSGPRGNLVSLIRFENRNARQLALLKPGDRFDPSAHPNIVAGRGGFYIRSARDKVVLKADAQGRVIEMAKYIVH